MLTNALSRANHPDRRALQPRHPLLSGATIGIFDWHRHNRRGRLLGPELAQTAAIFKQPQNHPLTRNMQRPPRSVLGGRVGIQRRH